MAEIREIIIDLSVRGSEQLSNIDAPLESAARNANLSEAAVKKLNDQIQKQVGTYSALESQLKKVERLENQLKAERDPNSIKRFNTELEKERSILRGLESQAKKTNRELAKGFRDAEKEAGRFEKTISGIDLGSILNIGVGSAVGLGISALAGLFSSAGSAIGDFVQSSAQAAIDFETVSQTFEVFLGSADAARRTLQELEEFSVSTPFEPTEITESARALLAFGEPAENLVSTLRTLGDIASGVNRPIEDLAVAYGKVRVANLAYAEDLNVFTESGIPIIQTLAQELGVTEAQVKKLASEGKVSFDLIEQSFKTLTSEGGKFFGLTQAQSTTTAGRISTLQGAFTSLQRELGQNLLPILSPIVDALTSITNGVVDFVRGGQEVETTLQIQQREFNNLTNSLITATRNLDQTGLSEQQLQIRQEERGRILQELNKRYSEYLPDLLTERTSIEGIRDAQRDVNTEFERRITLLATQEVVQGYISQIAQLKDELFQNSQAAQANREELERLQNLPTQGEATSRSIGTLNNRIREGQLQAQGFRDEIERLTAAAAEIGDVEIDFNLGGGEDPDPFTPPGATTPPPRTRQLIEGTVAFLRQQVADLQEELDFVIQVDDFASRQRILSQIQVLNNQIAAANQAFKLTGELDDDSLREDVAEIEPVKVPTELDIPDAADVIAATQENIPPPKIESEFDLEGIRGGLEESLTITRGVTNTIGNLFDQLAERRIQRENLSEQEIAKIRRNQLVREKAFAAVQGAIQGALVALKYASVLGPIGAILAGAVVGGALGIINSAQVPGFKTGVFDLDNRPGAYKIPGPGSGTSDSILARLSKGESVVSAKNTAGSPEAVKALVNGTKLIPMTIGGQQVYGTKPFLKMPTLATVRGDLRGSTLDMDRLAEKIAEKSLKVNFGSDLGNIADALAFANGRKIRENNDYLINKGYLTQQNTGLTPHQLLEIRRRRRNG